MNPLKIAYTTQAQDFFQTNRPLVLAGQTDYTDIAGAVLTVEDAALIHAIYDTKFGVPIFIVAERPEEMDPALKKKAYRIIQTQKFEPAIVNNEIESAAKQYEDRMVPPFFETLSEYIGLQNLPFDCPGHQAGQYFKKHPAGRCLYEFYGENIFRSDICNADVALGDLLIHEGPPEVAERNAAKLFNADRTYFVMNGTSTSNMVAVRATLAPGDLVLFDRNNHKSIYESALITAGADAVFLETARNPFGFIGGIDDHCFEESYLRQQIQQVRPEQAKAPRPFRLAVIQLGTYDGTIYNARQVVDRIGHLCDYILFDSAWVGYEQFIPMMKDCSPLLLTLGEDDPGILVTQSVHKQQAGFSQSSYIHKKDKHIRGQKRYIGHKRFNNAFRLHASTSPFYPIFASLDINARIQGSEAGKRLWADCVKMGIEARKSVLRECTMLTPFIPPEVDGKKWEDYETEEIAQDIRFFRFEPDAKWHAFEGYGKDQYFVDPNKFMLKTPGIHMETGQYEDFGIPATILANYLRDNRIIPEKNDFNSILFLLTPAETPGKLDALIGKLERFEQYIEENADLSEVLPYLYKEHLDRYRGYTIRELCQEMHDFYREKDAKKYQKLLFRREYFPQRAMSARDAQIELTKNNAKLMPLSEILDEVALEGALPYPPGIFCVAPGERWNQIAQQYFLILEEGINRFPGFAPEIHGVYLEKENNRTVAYAYVLEGEK